MDMNGKPSSSSMSRIIPPLRGDRRSYQIHLSRLFILLSILSSASIALIIGRVTTFYYDYGNASLQPNPNPPGLEAKVQLHIIPESESERCEVVVAKYETIAKDKVNYEALVHPAMITHPNPKKVMIIEGREKADTSAIKLEVLKHTSVQEVVVIVLENEKDALNEVAPSGLFDVIIEASPVTVVAGEGRSHSHISKFLFNCLKDDGIVSDINIRLTLLNLHRCIYMYSWQFSPQHDNFLFTCT